MQLIGFTILTENTKTQEFPELLVQLLMLSSLLFCMAQLLLIKIFYVECEKFERSYFIFSIPMVFIWDHKF